MCHAAYCAATAACGFQPRATPYIHPSIHPIFLKKCFGAIFNAQTFGSQTLQNPALPFKHRSALDVSGHQIYERLRSQWAGAGAGAGGRCALAISRHSPVCVDSRQAERELEHAFKKKSANLLARENELEQRVQSIRLRVRAERVALAQRYQLKIEEALRYVREPVLSSCDMAADVPRPSPCDVHVCTCQEVADS